MSERAETNNPATPKHRRDNLFQSGPGATRTRDLLLRSAGLIANHRQPALILPEIRAFTAGWR